MNSLKAALSIGFLAALAISPARATVIVTYAEKPGIETSTFINATTYNFNDLSLGLNTNVDWAGVGEFNQLYIKTADHTAEPTTASTPFRASAPPSPARSSTSTRRAATSASGGRRVTPATSFGFTAA